MMKKEALSWINRVAEIDAQYASGLNYYKNGEKTPGFSEWLRGYHDLKINSETLPILDYIYHKYIYNVAERSDDSLAVVRKDLVNQQQEWESQLSDFEKN